MHHRFYEDEDGNWVQEFDSDALDYFIDGLVELRDNPPGKMLSTPSIVYDDDKMPEGVAEFIITRVEDKDPDK